MIKIKINLLLLICVVHINLNAQNIGINATGALPHVSAILDVQSTTKGFLMPRMTTAQRTAIATPAEGLKLYDTDTKTFWFYNGTAWSQLSVGNNAWNLTGNAGTVPANHFLGTTDAQPLRFRVNNTWAGEIHPSNANTSMGIDAGKSYTSGINNTAFGIAALRNNVTASNNVAMGDSALFSQNGGGTNVAVGSHALFNNTTGDANTGIGPYALFRNTDGGFNTAVGVNSLYNNVSGVGNTCIGNMALQFNTGSFNTATGSSALGFNTVGIGNVANGYQALYFNTGERNTGTGIQSLYANTLGQDNTANGAYALLLNTTATQNTAVGSNALFSQSYNNLGATWISANTAIGYASLYHNSPTSTGSGINNTAVGNSSLFNNTTGSYNTATGMNALNANINGTFNTAYGMSALVSNASGSVNTAIGYSALGLNTSGGWNTAIGPYALQNLISGSENIAIGYLSGTASGSPGVTNTVSIGNNGYLNAASNQAFLGNLSTLWNGGNKTWSTFSDARMKNNIKDDVKGLDFIMRLKPVTYFRSIKEVLKITGDKDTKDFPGKYDVEKIKESGFLAQQVEQAAKDAQYDFSGVTVPKSPNQLYTLSYEQFVVPLVKAMQEQQEIIKNQQTQIDQLVKRLEALEIKK